MTAGEIGVYMKAIRDGLAQEHPNARIKWWPVLEQDDLERPLGMLHRPGRTDVIRLDVKAAKIMTLEGTELHLEDPELFEKLAG